MQQSEDGGQVFCVNIYYTSKWEKLILPRNYWIMICLQNGNWQWAAGTGCDAAPYFRFFNPEIQQKKFDKKRNLYQAMDKRI
jgi:hypothetical protein